MRVRPAGLIDGPQFGIELPFHPGASLSAWPLPLAVTVAHKRRARNAALPTGARLDNGVCNLVRLDDISKKQDRFL